MVYRVGSFCKLCYNTDNPFALAWGILEGMIILRIFLISCILRLRTKPDDEKWYRGAWFVVLLYYMV